MKAALICGTLGFASLFVSSPLGAAVSWELTATNNLMVAANDFHVEFSGTGGSVNNVVLHDIPGGDGVASLSGPVGGSAGINVVWATTMVMAGQSIKLEFTTEGPGILVEEAYWTWNGVNVGNATVALRQVPTPGALAVLLSGCGVACVRRRR